MGSGLAPGMADKDREREERLAAQLRAIVGLELPLAGVTAKWKASQNRSEADRLGVIAALAAAGNPLAAHIPAPEQPESKAGPSGGKIPCQTG